MRLNARRTGHADIVAEQIREAADDVRLSPLASPARWFFDTNSIEDRNGLSPRQLRHRDVSRSPPSTHAVTQHERRTPSSGQRASAGFNSSSTAFHQRDQG